ncbi:hypothetical protein D3C85_1186730 [compost metagenome]
MENSSASKAPMQAVSVVIARISGRVPAVAAQMNGKKPCGGCAGGVSGYGFTRLSNHDNIKNTPFPDITASLCQYRL